MTIFSSSSKQTHLIQTYLLSFYVQGQELQKKTIICSAKEKNL